MQSAAVYACVRVIAETVASLPLHLYRYVDEGKSEIQDILCTFSCMMHESEMTSFIFRETMMTHLLLWGNSYSQILRNGHGEITGLYPLLPDKMQVSRNETDELIYLYQSGMKNIAFRKEEILHIPGLGFDAWSATRRLQWRETPSAWLWQQRNLGRVLRKRSRTGGILEHPGTLKDPSKVRESWNQLFKAPAMQIRWLSSRKA